MAGVAGVLCAAAGAVVQRRAGGGSSGRSAAAPAAGLPDLVIVNARVWTVDPSRPEAEAVAVTGDRIVAVGSRAEVETLRGAGHASRGRRRPVPHARLQRRAHPPDDRRRSTRQRRPEGRRHARRSSPAASASARKHAAKGEWVLGGNWDEQGWPGAPLPTRQHRGRADAGHAGVRQPLRRAHVAGQLGRAAPGRRHRDDARPAGRRDRARRAGQSDRDSRRTRRRPTSSRSSRRQPANSGCGRCGAPWRTWRRSA